MNWKKFAALALLAASAGAWAEDAKTKKKPDFPPWSTVGKDLTGAEGFWNYYQDKKKTKFLLGVPSSHLNKPFLLATSVSGGSRMAGHQWNDWMLVWQVHDKKLVLLERNLGITGKDKEIKEAVKRTYTDRVLTTYRILTRGPKGGYVVDGQRMLAAGASLFFGGMGRSKDASLATFDGSKNFTDNTEVSVTMPAANGNLQTLHYSISRLQGSKGYKPRAADDRVGFFLTRLRDFSSDNRDDRRYLRYVNRWHLQKKEPKMRLSPPTRHIEFYLEKTVPYRFRRYVREGILEWNKAFRKIGFDDPIVVYEQREDNEHANKSPEDIRYNFFRWIVSDTPFAMGPSRVNPRTGEILDADILFDDSFIRYTLDEYRLTMKQLPVKLTGVRGREMLPLHPFAKLGFVPAPDEILDAVPADAARPNLSPHMRRAFCGIGNGFHHQLGACALWLGALAAAEPATPAANGEFPEELMGQFIKDTVMHEVGHTLGLRHNFKASIYRSLDEIHSEKKPGDTGGSVMDYQPIAIAPEGKPQGNFSMTTLGPYDYWAVEYGYTTDEKALPKVLERVAEKGLDYATDEDQWSNDPYVDTWDLGADPLAYAKSRLKLMQRLRKNLEERAVSKGEGYNRLRRAFLMQLYEAYGSATTAARYIGGEHMHRDHRGDPNARAPLVPVDTGMQREALRFICEEILSGKYFDFDPDLLRKLGPDFWADDYLALFFGGYEFPILDEVLRIQTATLLGVTGPDRLNRVMDARHKVAAGTDLLAAPEIFDALQEAIFGNLQEVTKRHSSNQMPALNDMQRNLQREYVTHLIYILLKGEGWYSASIQTLVRHYVSQLANDIGDSRRTAIAELDTFTRAHLEECEARLRSALKASYTLD